MTQQERVLSQFECHLTAYLEERKGDIAGGWISKRVKETLALIRECMNVEDLYRPDSAFIDLAGFVQGRTLEQALDRLERVRLVRT